jgi:hypothetical protein
MRALRLISWSLVLVALALTAAEAGTVLVVETWAYDPYSDTNVATLYLGDGKIRADVVQKDKKSSVIFDATNKDAPVMWILDPTALTYTKMDKAALDKIRGAVQSQLEMFNTYTAKMTQEEKAEFGKQYKKELRQADEIVKYDDRMKKSVYELAASGENLKGWACDRINVTFDKKPYKEMWVASFAELGIEPADVAVVTAVTTAFGAFAGDTQPFVGRKVQKSDKPIDGYPVKVVFYEEGNKIVREELKEIRKENVDPKLFELPADYKEAPLEGR